MCEPRVSQPELNYIFRNRRILFSSTQLVDEKLVALLQKKPIGPPLALVCCWRNHFNRHGLSPFTLHYLSKSKKSIKTFFKNLTDNPLFYVFQCTITNLPVVQPQVSQSWQNNTWRANVDPYFGEKYLNKYSWEVKRFNQLLPLYEQSKHDDEAMRTFSGSPIPKSSWQYLKNVVAIYED